MKSVFKKLISCLLVLSTGAVAMVRENDYVITDIKYAVRSIFRGSLSTDFLSLVEPVFDARHPVTKRGDATVEGNRFAGKNFTLSIERIKARNDMDFLLGIVANGVTSSDRAGIHALLYEPGQTKHHSVKHFGWYQKDHNVYAYVLKLDNVNTFDIQIANAMHKKGAISFDLDNFFGAFVPKGCLNADRIEYLDDSLSHYAESLYVSERSFLSEEQSLSGRRKGSSMLELDLSDIEAREEPYEVGQADQAVQTYIERADMATQWEENTLTSSLLIREHEREQEHILNDDPSPETSRQLQNAIADDSTEISVPAEGKMNAPEKKGLCARFYDFLMRRGVKKV